MAVEQFCLKWNNFQTMIINAFGSLQSSEDLTDVTLTCEGIRIKAHKIILSACSPYFRSIFKENPCPHPVVIFKDVFYDDLLAVLNFMYRGEVLITQDKLDSFLQTAETLQVSGLVGNIGLRDNPMCNINLMKGYSKVLKTDAKSKGNSEVSSPPNLQKSPEKCDIVDSVKVEICEDDSHSDYNCNDKIDVCNSNNSVKSQGSILEAALEVKDNMQPSILERSLTSHSSKSPQLDNIADVQESNPYLPDTFIIKHIDLDKQGVKHKLSETRVSPFSTADGPQQKNCRLDEDDVNQDFPSDIVVLQTGSDGQQPHHSSQCGNCPHCGKTYSNQSALKYHVRLVHSDLTNMHCCHLCPESFDYREGYKKHMAEAHSIRN